MVLVSYSGREINAKLVYYGPGLSGKTTNLESIYGSIPQGQRGKMVSMKTKTERTLFFDFLPVNLGELSGFKTRFLLYTVPGQVYYNATRKLVLKGVDAVVFVADSKRGKMDENVESLENLKENLKEHGLTLEQVPWVIQYNKRDLPDVYTMDELETVLNPSRVPAFEGVATTGQGVVETFKGVSRLLLRKLAKDIGVTVIPAGEAPAGAEPARGPVPVMSRPPEPMAPSMPVPLSAAPPSAPAPAAAYADPPASGPAPAPAFGPASWPASPAPSPFSSESSVTVRSDAPVPAAPPAPPPASPPAVPPSVPSSAPPARITLQADPIFPAPPAPPPDRDEEWGALRLVPCAEDGSVASSLPPPAERIDTRLMRSEANEPEAGERERPSSVGERLRRWLTGGQDRGRDSGLREDAAQEEGLSESAAVASAGSPADPPAEPLPAPSPWAVEGDGHRPPPAWDEDTDSTRSLWVEENGHAAAAWGTEAVQSQPGGPPAMQSAERPMEEPSVALGVPGTTVAEATAASTQSWGEPSSMPGSGIDAVALAGPPAEDSFEPSGERVGPAAEGLEPAEERVTAMEPEPFVRAAAENERPIPAVLRSRASLQGVRRPREVIVPIEIHPEDLETGITLKLAIQAPWWRQDHEDELERGAA